MLPGSFCLGVEVGRNYQATSNTMEKYQPLPKEKILLIPVYRAEGKTNQEIADMFGVNLRRVLYWVRRLRDKSYTVKKMNKGGRPHVNL